MIIINESNDDWSGYFVLFTYDGDALSPYETTVIVKATSEKDAINKAERDIKKDPAFLDKNPHNFRIDRSRSNGKINSYNVYKNKFKNSNFKVIAESAKDAIIPNTDSKHIVASQINLNIVGEYDALDGYQKLIPWFEKYNDQEAIDTIKEISSDEKNHAMLLREILKRYDGNIPTAKD